jgi:hypothetical protein
MATHQTEVYTIWCVLSDEVSQFRIKVESGEQVIALKEKIKEANPSLANFGAHHLKLYLFEIENMAGDDKKEVVRRKLSEGPTELDSKRYLAEVFKEGIKANTLLVVQRPTTGMSAWSWRLTIMLY